MARRKGRMIFLCQALALCLGCRRYTPHSYSARDDACIYRAAEKRVEVGCHVQIGSQLPPIEDTKPGAPRAGEGPDLPIGL